jgi:hypothetical protein
LLLQAELLLQGVPQVLVAVVALLHLRPVCCLLLLRLLPLLPLCLHLLCLWLCLVQQGLVLESA